MSLVQNYRHGFAVPSYGTYDAGYEIKTFLIAHSLTRKEFAIEDLIAETMLLVLRTFDFEIRDKLFY